MSKITIFCGPMFAGKTQELLRAANTWIRSRQPVVLIKHSRNTRDGVGEICTHDGFCVSATQVSSAKEIPEQVGPDTHAVFVDEAQLFDDAIVDVCNSLAQRGVNVFLAGLDRDSSGRSFGPMGALLVAADHVVKLTARCHLCGDEASFSQRLRNGVATHDGPVVHIGGSDSYQARCRACYVCPS